MVLRNPRRVLVGTWVPGVVHPGNPGYHHVNRVPWPLRVTFQETINCSRRRVQEYPSRIARNTRDYLGEVLPKIGEYSAGHSSTLYASTAQTYDPCWQHHYDELVLVC